MQFFVTECDASVFIHANFIFSYPLEMFNLSSSVLDELGLGRLARSMSSGLSEELLCQIIDVDSIFTTFRALDLCRLLENELGIISAMIGTHGSDKCKIGQIPERLLCRRALWEVIHVNSG